VTSKNCAANNFRQKPIVDSGIQNEATAQLKKLDALPTWTSSLKNVHVLGQEGAHAEWRFCQVRSQSTHWAMLAHIARFEKLNLVAWNNAYLSNSYVWTD
jgi:uncharacterized membrane protein